MKRIQPCQKKNEKITIKKLLYCLVSIQEVMQKICRVAKNLMIIM